MESTFIQREAGGTEGKQVDTVLSSLSLSLFWAQN